MGIEKLCVGSGEIEFTIEVEGEKFTFAKRELSWTKINAILGQCIDLNSNGSVKMDIAKYNTECLVAMLTKAPWDLSQTRIVLAQLKPEVGRLLGAHVPSFENVMGETEDTSFFDDKSGTP